EHRGGLSYARGGVLGLARFPAASQEHAAPGRDPYGHRRGPFTALEIQGVLGADPGGARPQAGLRCLATMRREAARQAAAPPKTRPPGGPNPAIGSGEQISSSPPHTMRQALWRARGMTGSTFIRLLLAVVLAAATDIAETHAQQPKTTQPKIAQPKSAQQK